MEKSLLLMRVLYGSVLPMFLRINRKRVNGESYEYWTLCESYRTERGPRQRVVASLGKLAEEDLAAGWEEMEALLDGHKPGPIQRELFAEDRNPPASRWEMADLNNMSVERVRDFGSVFLSMALWRRLDLHKLLLDLIPQGKEDIPWAEVAAVLTAGKFCGQASELAIAEHWYPRTAMDEITGIDPALVNDDRLYRALDQLLPQKDALCEHLMKRYWDWFGVRFEFLLYDVTSTYFEGDAKKNDKAQRGYSRDHRPDCKQVCIGLVCTPEGLPLNYEVFSGNRTDVTTVQEIVRKMEERFGQAERIWVMDRGMVSEANITFLRERKALYIVGTPKSELRHFEKQLTDDTDWTDIHAGLEARLVEHPDKAGTEKYILCRSTQRAAKEQAMLARQMDHLTEELLKIDRQLRKRKTKSTDTGPLERRIGRWQGRYPAANRILEVKVLKDKAGQATGLSISCPVSQCQSQHTRHGTYLLRTNCTETDPAKIWQWYMQLTQAEAAFRSAKSDIGMRPVYHQNPERVEAHLLVCFLSLAMWRTLEMWMKSKGLGTSARKLIEAVGTIRSMDIIVPVKREEEIIHMRVRTVAKPDAEVSTLLSHLGLRLPKRSKMIKCSGKK